MCHAIPAQIVAIDEQADTATVALGEVKKDVSLALVQDVQLGDYVLIHVGYALNKISTEEAERTLQLFAEMAELDVVQP
ncbi:MAG: HypC/HybG/HupF family hydrogenase formation chaperone [Gammaproteobacteria bacterium]|nr:HypC/HybG/HupF family hydrogenase formation chaperone [Gammaproteobacteria bacterium]